MTHTDPRYLSSEDRREYSNNLLEMCAPECHALTRLALGLNHAAYMDEQLAVVEAEVHRLHDDKVAWAARASKAEAQVKELREALAIYANAENWTCPRCGKRDDLNCFMGRWTGPVDKGNDYSAVGHGYDTARAALARTAPAGTPEKLCLCNPYAEQDAERVPNCPVHKATRKDGGTAE